MSHATGPLLAHLGKFSALDVTTVEGLSHEQKQDIIAATSHICRSLMDDMGVKWKPQPVDPVLRRRTIDWIKSELEPLVGPVNKRFLAAADSGLMYTERVYEGGDFETKVSMVKYGSISLYLDDMIDKDAGMAKQAEGFLFNTLERGSLDSPSAGLHGIWLELYRKASLELARHLSDPLASNMLLHSCTLYIEGCALEYHIQRDQAKYFLIKDAGAERAKDDAERKLAHERGFDIPLPLDNDRVAAAAAADGTYNNDYLVPHGWPLWLRERSAVAEVYAITSFRAPGGVDVPTWLWVTAVPELRTVILAVNDVLSFAKELLADDTTSAMALLTKERRLIGMPGSAPDGGWCLRDTFDDFYGKIVVAAARINRLLRPNTLAARYAPDGHTYSIAELVDMLKGPEDEMEVSRDEVMKALALKLWETHQRDAAFSIIGRGCYLIFSNLYSPQYLSASARVRDRLSPISSRQKQTATSTITTAADYIYGAKKNPDDSEREFNRFVRTVPSDQTYEWLAQTKREDPWTPFRCQKTGHEAALSEFGYFPEFGPKKKGMSEKVEAGSVKAKGGDGGDDGDSKAAGTSVGTGAGVGAKAAEEDTTMTDKPEEEPVKRDEAKASGHDNTSFSVKLPTYSQS
ncbi:hypothetical protein B0T24DRAFT_663097 [Lasiosphaeria ovina]|uniref:Uncharacterized protein n=1 Tax=Lasiosphaeria ovina TaxID=92902 RepID=A0AAE0KM54_9PEZI|nr:hypothetical protein B0T24DRAFT_663097 [Lasiosphaeria ovina]